MLLGGNKLPDCREMGFQGERQFDKRKNNQLKGKGNCDPENVKWGIGRLVNAVPAVEPARTANPSTHHPGRLFIKSIYPVIYNPSFY
jgi:hypothetical protein